MSRFHDEFFKPKGTKHDELMLKCIDKIKEIAVWRRLPTNVSVVMCECNGSIYLGSATEVNEHNRCQGCSCNLQCRHHFTSLLNTVDCEIEYLTRKVEFTYETEVICRNGSFIIGYADMVIKTERHIDMITDGLVFNGRKCSIYPHLTLKDNIYTIVEIKPELNDIGAVIRQLKTYKDVLSKTEMGKFGQIYMVIATPVEVPNSAQNYLNHEGIEVYKIGAGV